MSHKKNITHPLAKDVHTVSSFKKPLADVEKDPYSEPLKSSMISDVTELEKWQEPNYSKGGIKSGSIRKCDDH